MGTTKSELITKFRSRPAFKGFATIRIGEFFEDALDAIAEYHCQKVIMRNIPADSENGIYDMPEEAREIVQVRVSESNARIDYEVFYRDGENGENGENNGERQILLGSVRLPSYTDLVNTEAESSIRGYELNRISRPIYGGSGYGTFDLIYSRKPTFESLHDKHTVALRLYSEHLAYEEKSESAENSIDIIDRDAAGESTTIKHSQRGNRQNMYSKDKYDQFLREMRRPYWTRSNLGIVERIWMDRGGLR